MGTIYRYVSAMTQVMFSRYGADYVLKRAVLIHGDGKTDQVTAETIAALAVGKLSVLVDNTKDPHRLLVISYTYKSSGPFSYYICPKNPSFPPTHGQANGSLIPPARQIIIAERPTEEDEDVTEEMLPFAGPDGTFHGLLFSPTDNWGDFDPRSIFPTIKANEEVSITFADDSTRTLVYNKEEDETV
ncbi:MAG: hypothetical protein P4L69_07235 [Desulfosporosinus sp.]|nr:hypothetical protein [Desulfosporosinus sp.]